MTTRRTGRSLAIVATALLALLVAAPTAQAKEGVEVALAAPISPDAKPGDLVPVFFTAKAITNTGESPLYGTNIFFRLYGPTGAMTEATGVEQGDRGTYKVTIEIPAGGAARAEFGIHGSSSNGPADIVWPYDGVLVAAAVPAAIDPGAFQLPADPKYQPVQPATGSGPALAGGDPAATTTSPAPFAVDPRAVGVGALALAVLAVLAVAGLRHRRQGQTTAA
jgi:hypothetical protein